MFAVVFGVKKARHLWDFGLVVSNIAALLDFLVTSIHGKKGAFGEHGWSFGFSTRGWDDGGRK